VCVQCGERTGLRLHSSLTLALDGGERVVSLAPMSFDLLGNCCVGLRLCCSNVLSAAGLSIRNPVSQPTASSARQVSHSCDLTIRRTRNSDDKVFTR